MGLSRKFLRTAVATAAEAVTMAAAVRTPAVKRRAAPAAGATRDLADLHWPLQLRSY